MLAVDIESLAAPGTLTAFGAGVLSFLSPCVLPLVPGYLSLISGISVAEVETSRATARRRIVGATLLFVLGFSVVFVAFGAVASVIGTLFLRHRQALTQLSGVLVICMGLTISGIFHPRVLLQEHRLLVSPSALGPYAAPVMGMAFAFGWTPCIGPVLASILALAASRNTLSSGVALLLAYSLGLGIPFVATGVAFGRLRGTWSWCKRHGRALDAFAGIFLMFFGVLMLTSSLGRLSTGVTWMWTHVGAESLRLG